jgi:hypothetical protein
MTIEPRLSGSLSSEDRRESVGFGDVVVGVVGVVADVEADPADVPGEVVLAARPVGVGDDRRGVAADGRGLVGGEQDPDRVLDSSLAGLVPVDEDGGRRAFSQRDTTPPCNLDPARRSSTTSTEPGPSHSGDLQLVGPDHNHLRTSALRSAG